MSQPTLVALIHGPDRRGIVAHASGWIFRRRGNILHADQHRDAEAGIFFQRIEWTPAPGADRAAEQVAFLAYVRDRLGMTATVRDSTHRVRVALFASRADHCFHDLVLRWRAGELPCDLVAVVSNHRELAADARRYRLAFHHLPITPETKASVEARQVVLLRRLRVDLVILARYMQVLSGTFLAQLGRPIINIHHSFLPAFAGARPYHQAHTRGVKLIGATAHYATQDLDEGPIIHQDVARITHRHGVEALMQKGRDIEKTVLAQAVRWHLESRVLVYGNKTVVFD